MKVDYCCFSSEPLPSSIPIPKPDSPLKSKDMKPGSPPIHFAAPTDQVKKAELHADSDEVIDSHQQRLPYEVQAPGTKSISLSGDKKPARKHRRAMGPSIAPSVTKSKAKKSQQEVCFN